VGLAILLDQLPPEAELGAEIRGIVTGNGKAGALQWAVRREGCKDREPVLEIGRLLQSLQISLPILFGDHEMEERSVVPHDITPRWLPGPHIAEPPLHLISCGTEALLSGLHPDDRHVKHSEIRLSTRQQRSGKW
jgi:hypothetical protein